VVGTDGFLVVFKRDSEELVFELERLRESGEVGGRSGCRVDGGDGSDLDSGGSVVSVWNGIHFHWEKEQNRMESQFSQIVTRSSINASTKPVYFQYLDLNMFL